MPLFGNIFGIDDLRAEITQLRREVAVLGQQNTLLRQGQTQLRGEIMANFAKFEEALNGLAKEVTEVIELLTTDAADQAKIDEAVEKLTTLKDALDTFTPEPTA